MLEQVRSHNTTGITLARQGRFAEAAASFEAALQLDPNYGHGYNNLANVLMFQGKLEAAVANYEKALQLMPDDPETLNNLSNSLRQLGRNAEAEARARKALEKKPNYPEALNHLGIALEQQGKLEEAADCYQRALGLRHDFAEAFNNFGNLRRLQGRFQEAAAHCSRAVAINPRLAGAHNNLGAAYIGLGKPDEALASCQTALTLDPNLAEAHCNIGAAYLKKGEFAHAQAACNAALKLNPNFADVHNLLGIVAMKEGKLDESITHFDRAIQLKPDFPQHHFHRSMALLASGNLAEGFAEYEWRWKCKDFAPKPFATPIWDGKPVVGKTVLLHTEQGLGDAIQFIRYAKKVKEMGAKVVVACQDSLQKLITSCNGIDQVIPKSLQPPAHEEHVPLLSLPRVFSTQLDSIPNEVPYLFPEAALVEYWKQQLAAHTGFKVGICWRGNPDHPDDQLRSISLMHFAPLASLQGVRLISLQKGSGANDVKTAGFPIIDFGERVDSAGGFLDTVAIIQSLDLVVTSDTAVAHAAGALGKPVWVCLPYAPDWRWMLNREDSPWYPTMKLFRQQRIKDWDNVFQRIGAKLSSLVKSRPPSVVTLIEVSPGELIDRISILLIKRDCVGDPDKLLSIHNELEALNMARESLPQSTELTNLAAELKEVNETLWDAEDGIRRCEKDQNFGPQFVELARSIYRQNDRRSELKQRINNLLGAKSSEVKVYAS